MEINPTHRSRDRYPASPPPPAAVSLVGRRQHDFPGQRPPAHVAVVVIDVVTRSTTTLADQRLRRACLAFLPRVLTVKQEAAWERRGLGALGAAAAGHTGYSPASSDVHGPRLGSAQRTRSRTYGGRSAVRGPTTSPLLVVLPIGRSVLAPRKVTLVNKQKPCTTA